MHTDARNAKGEAGRREGAGGGVRQDGGTVAERQRDEATDRALARVNAAGRNLGAAAGDPTGARSTTVTATAAAGLVAAAGRAPSPPSGGVGGFGGFGAFGGSGGFGFGGSGGSGVVRGR